jgi:hypothetical protein
MADQQFIDRLNHYITAGNAGTLVPSLTWDELREMGELAEQLAALFESARVHRAEIDQASDPQAAMDEYMREAAAPPKASAAADA